MFLSGILAVDSCKESEYYEYYGDIYGIVVDADSNNPLSGVQVTISPGNKSTVTGSIGSYEFQKMEPGQYKLLFSASGYKSNTRQVTIVSGEKVTCDVQMEKEEQITGMELSATSLEFGTHYDEMTFSIRNKGNAGELVWNISNITADWLKVSPMDGIIDIGKSNSIKVSVDRRLIDRDVSTTINVNAAGESRSVRISVMHDDGSANKPKMELSTKNLDFGTDYDELSFDVRNTGISEDLEWSVSNITVDWLSVVPTKGTAAAGKYASVKVVVNRSLIKEDVNTIFTVSGAGVSESVNVNVKHVPEEEEKPSMELSVSKLDFGVDYNELAFSVKNTAKTLDLAWSISDISVDWLTVSPMHGSTSPGRSTSIKVTVDRNKITDDVSTIFDVEAGEISKSVNVTVQHDGKSNGNVTNGLYAFYTFENNTKNNVEGASNAIGINSPEYVEGINGTKAMKFNSSSESYLNIGEPLLDQGAFTVSFWIKGLSDGHLFHVVDKPSRSLNYTYVLAMKNGFLTFIIGSYGLKESAFDEMSLAHSSINSQQWNMIAITSTYSSGKYTIKLYLNGEYMDVNTESWIGGYPPIGTGEKFIMAGSLPYEYESRTMKSPAGMTVDNLRIYNTRALSDKEIQQLYKYESNQ